MLESYRNWAVRIAPGRRGKLAASLSPRVLKLAMPVSAANSASSKREPALPLDEGL